MMPEMKCVLEKALESSLRQGLQVLLLQALGGMKGSNIEPLIILSAFLVFAGIGAMAGMARFGSQISLI